MNVREPCINVREARANVREARANVREARANVRESGANVRESRAKRQKVLTNWRRNGRSDRFDSGIVQVHRSAGGKAVWRVMILFATARLAGCYWR